MFLLQTRLCSESANLRHDMDISAQPAVIRNSNPGFWINLDLDLDVCCMASKMMWIHYLVGRHQSFCRVS